VVLAHAFGPGRQPISGDSHFDDDEDWSYHESRGIELETVAAHEFGHALGLGHSSVYGALMAPYYKGYDPEFELHSDDVKGIQRIYGMLHLFTLFTMIHYMTVKPKLYRRS